MKNKIFQLLPIIALLLVDTALAEDTADQELFDRDRDEWISAVNSKERAVAGSLFLFKFKDPMYVLLKEISWQPDDDSPPEESVVVPEGFVTDLASIPPIFYSFLRPDGEYAHAAILHDYLYWNQETTRSEADKIFRSAMRDLDVSDLKVKSIYRAVRWGGESAWRSNGDQKKAGERRLLLRFPQDPRMTWAEWKADSDVFK